MVSYLPEHALLLPAFHRKRLLREGWDFDCDCQRCSCPLDSTRCICCPTCTGPAPMSTDSTRAHCSRCATDVSQDHLRRAHHQERILLDCILQYTADEVEGFLAEEGPLSKARPLREHALSQHLERLCQVLDNDDLLPAWPFDAARAIAAASALHTSHFAIVLMQRVSGQHHFRGALLHLLFFIIVNYAGKIIIHISQIRACILDPLSISTLPHI